MRRTACTVLVPEADSALRRWCISYVLEERLGLRVTFAQGAPDAVVVCATGATASIPSVRPHDVLRLDAVRLVDGVALPEGAVVGGQVAWFDAIAAVLAGLDEHRAQGADLHGRVPASSSWLVRNELAQVPIVDVWIASLASHLAHAGVAVAPEQAEAVVSVSHDVDIPFIARPPGPLRTTRALLRAARGELGARRAAIRGVLASTLGRADQDPLYTFDRLLRGHRQAARRATLFVLADASHPKDARYRLRDPEVQRLLGAWLDDGHRVGLHGGYATWDDADELCWQADRLRSTLSALGHADHPIGGRQHFLRWRPEVTSRAYVRAGLAYDATVGFADRPGFRRGIARDFPAFDVLNDRPLPLRVEPLIMMECSLYAARYQGYAFDSAEAADWVQRLRGACVDVGGCFSVLWHNSELLTEAAWAAYERSVDAPV